MPGEGTIDSLRAMLPLRRLLGLTLLWTLPVAPILADDDDGEEEPTIEGVVVERGDGEGYLGLTIDGNSFVLRFYDDEKFPEEPDATRATARWKVPGRSGRNHAVLNLARNALVSPALARPPFIYRVYISLLPEEDDVGGEVEGYYFDLKELDAEAPAGGAQEADRY